MCERSQRSTASAHPHSTKGRRIDLCTSTRQKDHAADGSDQPLRVAGLAGNSGRVDCSASSRSDRSQPSATFGTSLIHSASLCVKFRLRRESPGDRHDGKGDRTEA